MNKKQHNHDIENIKIYHINRLLLFIVLVLYQVTLNAATFCVSTSAEFQNALSTAESNGEDNLIKVRLGNYSLTNGLIYEANSDNNLEISGGWSFFFGNFCGIQSSKNPYLTELNGGSVTRILRIIPGKFTDIKISYLTFSEGFIGASSLSGLSGAGIDMVIDNSSEMTAYDGNVSILHNVFMSNEAVDFSAVNVSGNKIIFQNNLYKLWLYLY